jgi:hypothetical protein
MTDSIRHDFKNWLVGASGPGRPWSASTIVIVETTGGQ